jgi:hypothetical protein
MSTVEWPLAYGGCALKTVVGLSIFLPIGCLEVAVQRHPTEAGG